MKNLYNITIKNKTKSGFTIVEVTLVMAFIGMLLIAIAMIMMNMSSLYQKGLTIKSVNSVGRGLISELTTAINSAPSIDSISLCTSLIKDIDPVTQKQKQNQCIANGAFQYVYQTREGVSEHDSSQNVQYNGVLCTGRYTYIWNTYAGIKKGQTIKIEYYDKNIAGTSTQTLSGDIRLAKFEDPDYRTCSSITQNESDYLTQNKIDIRNLPNGNTYKISTPVTNLLDDTDVSLFLYELTIFPVTQDVVTLRAFFSGTFILATNRGDVNILRTGDYCSPNATSEIDGGGNGSTLDLGSEFNYCAINKFNFAARTTGSVVK